MKNSEYKKKNSLHNTNIIIEQINKINQSELIRESDQILKYSWQNIVLVVSLMVFIMFIGYQFMMKHDVEKDQTTIFSKESVAIDDVFAAETDEVIDIGE